MTRTRHRLMRAASWLPERVLRWLDKRTPGRFRDESCFSFWTDASYWQWCRHDERRAL